MIFLKCKIRFICRIQLQKKKSGVKNVWKFVPLRGGVGRLMANAILNFHFDYLTTSLRLVTSEGNVGPGRDGESDVTNADNGFHFPPAPPPAPANFQLHCNQFSNHISWWAW